MKFEVNPSADAPNLRVGDAGGADDSAIALDVSAALTDTDGSKNLATMACVSSGASLSAGTDADVFVESAGSDIATGDKGADTFLMLEASGQNIYRGGSGVWTDVIDIQGANGADPGSGWSFVLTDGSVIFQSVDGTTLYFSEVEGLNWWRVPAAGSRSGEIQFEQVDGVGAGDLQPVGVRQFSALEPRRCFGERLERVVDREQDAPNTHLGERAAER